MTENRYTPEQFLVGCILSDPGILDDVLETLGSLQCLSDPRHRRIVQTLVSLGNASGDIPSARVLVSELERLGKMEEAGGSPYVTDLLGLVVDPQEFRHYAQSVYNNWIANKGSSTLSDALGSLGGPRPDVVLSSVVSDLEQILVNQGQGEISPVGTIAEAAIFSASERKRLGIVISGISTGYPYFDELTGGFQAGDFVTVAARPSMGKTAFGIDMALRMAQNRDSVAFVSLEMSAAQIATRFVSRVAEVDSMLIKRGLYNDVEAPRLVNAVAKLKDLPLWMNEDGATMLNQYSRFVRFVKAGVRKFGWKAVFVDYLQLMDYDIELVKDPVGKIADELKQLAKNLGIVIIGFSQMSRANMQRQDKRPVISDMRESGRLEQASDVIILLHREDYYRKAPGAVMDGLVEIDMAKDRNGAVGRMVKRYRKEVGGFYDVVNNNYTPPDHTADPTPDDALPDEVPF